MEPDSSLEREDVFTLLASLPERVSDLLSGVDQARLRYRHGPAFPTLEEVLHHLSDTAQRMDAAFRRAYLDKASELEIRNALDAPFDSAGGEPADEILQTYSRIRRRTVDLLRGLEADELERPLQDPVLGELSLLDAARLVVTHEVGHLTQIRNLVSVLPETEDLGPIAAVVPLEEAPNGE